MRWSGICADIRPPRRLLLSFVLLVFGFVWAKEPDDEAGIHTRIMHDLSALGLTISCHAR